MDSVAQGGASGANGPSTMTKAQKFEDEKNRIIESCFSKKDDDGILQESYITHIRVEEDAAYPSSPPPPNNDPSSKKPRIIIVAVRKSGRVRMHKARENANGTFSIGKTWVLDDLSAVESFSGSPPKNAEEEQRKQWAGDIGFIVTIGKPYYWQANSPKEKHFFITSLVKIYTKYTGGKRPELIGFDDEEMEAIISGSAQTRPRPLAPGSQSSVQPPPVSSPPYDQTQSRVPRSAPPRETPPRQISQEQSLLQQSLPSSTLTNLTSSSQAQRLTSSSRRDGSPNSSIDSTGAPPSFVPSSLRKVAAANQSQESFSSRDDASSLPPRSRGGPNGLGNAPGRFPDRSATPSSLRAGTPDNGIQGGREGIDDIPPVPAPLTFPPERRRPPLQGSPESSRSRRLSNENLVPAPLSSPGMLRDNSRPSTRGTDRPDAPQMNLMAAMNRSEEVATDSRQPLNAKSDIETAAAVQQSENVEQSTTSQPIDSPTTPVQDERPGLGSMIKKKSRTDIANTFRKAATAASAFKPRAGGAAERLREQQIKSTDGPDGITEVVPAPSLRGLNNDNMRNPAPGRTGTPDQDSKEKTASFSQINEIIPEVKIRPSSGEAPLSKENENESEVLLPEKAKAREAKRPKPISDTIQKDLSSLGLDASLFDGRGDRFAELLDEFGWSGEGVHTRNIDQMKEDIDRELNNVEVGGWIRRIDEDAEKRKALSDGIDRVLAEVDDYDNLLTLLNVELGTLSEDIAYIEAQGQGLQVQAANQKILQAELQSLLDTVSISSSQLQSLREAPFETSQGLEQIEASLVMLFKAMVTIDPTLGFGAPNDGVNAAGTTKGSGVGNSEIANMRVLREKKDSYRTESMAFMRRLKKFMEGLFERAIAETKNALERDKEASLSRRTGKVKVDLKHHDTARTLLWKYSPLLLFTREVGRYEWDDMMQTYESTYKPVYQDEIREAVFAWKRSARKPTGDENDILFTSQIEKQPEGIASTARKLTVKRSQTLAKTLRSPLGDNSSRTTIDKIQDGRIHPYEAFSNILDEIASLIIMEQNFVVEFFHVSSLEIQDFADNISATPPDLRRGGDLRKIKPMDPDRELSKRVVQSMEDIYSFVPGDLQKLVDWTIQAEPLQGIGVLVAIERKLLDIEESSQEFLVRMLQKTHSRLSGLFTKVLDEQIRAIEETKVKIKKRRGVIGFIRTFPSFSASLEAMLVSAEDLEVRETVNNAYNRVIKTMFESLKVIARELPSAATAGASMGDPEDKEALNYQILLIENMYHLMEEVETRNNPVLEEWKEKAAKEFEEHLNLYLGAVMHRPLGKLIDYLESTESQILSQGVGSAPTSITAKASHSKENWKKLLSTYDSVQVRRGAAELKKRIEKHYQDGDEANLSRSLIIKVLDACEKYYEDVEARIGAISLELYGGDLAVEWTKADVTGTLRR